MQSAAGVAGLEELLVADKVKDVEGGVCIAVGGALALVGAHVDDGRVAFAGQADVVSSGVVDESRMAIEVGVGAPQARRSCRRRR